MLLSTCVNIVNFWFSLNASLKWVWPLLSSVNEVNGTFCRFWRRGGEESERRRWLLSAEMWFPLPLTPASCLCYFCRNLHLFPPLSQSVSRCPLMFLSVPPLSFHSSYVFSFVCFCLSCCLLHGEVRLVVDCCFITHWSHISAANDRIWTESCVWTAVYLGLTETSLIAKQKRTLLHTVLMHTEHCLACFFAHTESLLLVTVSSNQQN